MSPLAFLASVLALQSGGEAWRIFVPMLIVMGIFYVLLIMPMRKQQKALDKLVTELKRGDRVITKSGLYGEIAAVEDTVVWLRIADNVKVKLAKSAIGGLEAEPEKGSKS
jgi:preprotein translocase subunit YajC